MSFWLGRDFFDNPIVPSYILCKGNKERIGSIKCLNKRITLNYNTLDEISFETYLYNDGEKNELYDSIDTMKYILLPGIGFYSINSIEINSEGTEYEFKTVVAKSYECLMAQKYLELFTINYGTTESIDNVRFYDLGEKSKSLMHLVLEKIPDWEIGHIDVGLETMERSFQVDRQDVYSFLTTEVSEAFECVFVFDTLNNLINIYKEENICKDTNVYVSYNNLLKNADISYSIDDIKTCLTLTGSDDLTIREINLGYDRIYNLGFYHSMEYMSRKLYEAWGKWVEKRNNRVDEYTELLSHYQDYIVQINYLTHEKMPDDDPESTNWSEYGLVPLKTELAEREQVQSVMMKSGQGNADSPSYQTSYVPLYNTIQAINTAISEVETELDRLKKEQDVYYQQMSAIIDDLAMENNFTEDELKELSTFIREDELTSDNYVVTSIMSDDERFEMLNEFLKHGEKELAKKATPQLTFNADLLNLFTMDEFSLWYNDFNVGNYIHVSLRDNYLIKAKLLTISFNFLDLTDFSVTFGNVVRNGDKLFDITEAIALAQSTATSVSFNSSYWNEAAKDTSTIGKMLEEGLISAGQYLKSGVNSEMVIDKRGIFINTVKNELDENDENNQYAGKDSIFIGGGRILFTDNNWESVAMAVGRAEVKGESRFGVFADFVIAGYIAASTMEGNKIIGGTIESTNYEEGKVGSFINLEEGTFEFNSNGEQKLTLDKDGTLTVKGTIKAELGYIGGSNGFTIDSGKLYSGKSSFSNNASGVYIGTDGIALGKNNAFSVDEFGNLIAKTGLIGGIKVEGSRIYSTNNNFEITDGGQATFKDVHISGVQSGSSFGGITYGDTGFGLGTYGNFSNGFYAGSSFGLTGGAETDFNNLVVGRIQAQIVEAGLVTADQLNAVSARVGRIEADYIKANQIDALVISAISNNATGITCQSININGQYLYCDTNYEVKWRYGY